jgi:hypothetical protein
MIASEMFWKFDEGLNRFGRAFDLLPSSICRANSDPPT